MNPTYNYVNNNPGSYTNPQLPGSQNSVSAPNAQTAIQTASNISPTSGVVTTPSGSGVNQNINFMGKNYDLSNPNDFNAYKSAINSTSSSQSTNPPKSNDQNIIDQAQQNLDKQNAQNEQAYLDFKKTADMYANGAMPLSAGQQAQIQGLTQQYQQLIDNQKKVNISAEGTANIRGYQKGSAEYDPNFQIKVIGNIFSAGQAKVADLNTKMASAIAQLTSAFQQENYTGVKDAYDAYTKFSEEQEKTFQKTMGDAQARIKEANDAKAAKEKLELEVAKYEKDFAEKVREFDLNQKGDKEKLSLEYAKLSHQLDVDAGTGIGNLDDAGLDMLARGYLTSGTLPSLGYGKSAIIMRTAVVNRAVKLSGGNDNVNPATNKAMYDANRATYTQQTKNYVVADTAYRIFDQNGNLALQLSQGLNSTNSPIINQLSNRVINQTTGTGQLDSFKAVVTSLQAEYATLINVKGGGGGVVTEGDKAKAEKAIPMDISPTRLKQVLDNLKTEGRNVLNERKQTLDTLQKNLTSSSAAFNNQVSDKPLVGQVITAESNGYSPKEIIDNIAIDPQYADAINQARSVGWTDEEIINYFKQQ